MPTAVPITDIERGYLDENGENHVETIVAGDHDALADLDPDELAPLVEVGSVVFVENPEGDTPAEVADNLRNRLTEPLSGAVVAQMLAQERERTVKEAPDEPETAPEVAGAVKDAKAEAKARQVAQDAAQKAVEASPESQDPEARRNRPVSAASSSSAAAKASQPPTPR